MVILAKKKSDFNQFKICKQNWNKNDTHQEKFTDVSMIWV